MLSTVTSPIKTRFWSPSGIWLLILSVLIVDIEAKCDKPSLNQNGVALGEATTEKKLDGWPANWMDPRHLTPAGGIVWCN